MKSAKGNKIERTYRLYGADCPESDGKDKLLKARITEQAEYFGVSDEEIPVLGKQAAAFTRELLADGKPRWFLKRLREIENRQLRNRLRNGYSSYVRGGFSALPSSRLVSIIFVGEWGGYPVENR